MKKIAKLLLLLALFLQANISHANYILIPMDEAQTDHLKSYGITYWVISQGIETFWLLNYRGGSFAFKQAPQFERECKIRNVKYEILPDGKYNAIVQQIANPQANMDVMKLEKTPKVAVYSPDVSDKGDKVQPWDDAVTLVLTYAEIPYDVIYDTEVLQQKLTKYDWLHLHHEDFTGQYGKFYASYRGMPWYETHVKRMEDLARINGFKKVSQCKLAVAKTIKSWVMGGGFMFAMCSATDTYDIALAAEGTDICAEMYDYDGADPAAQSKLDFSKTFAFKDFMLVPNPYTYEYSTIDATDTRMVEMKQDYFSLFDFSAKWDPVPTMLTQCHTRSVKGFMGQTTAFNRKFMKSEVLVLGEYKPKDEARYVHGEFGEGMWTFYGGHDPEDYRHQVGDPPTDLSLHPNSPGYRLILNNVLFPAAKKKKRKT
jgi:hypothetical protein